MGWNVGEIWAALQSRTLARPLIPLVLALMAGVAAPSWDLNLPPRWLVAGIPVLLAGLALNWRRRRPVLVLPLLLFCGLGLALSQEARAPSLPPHHLVHQPLGAEVSILGRVNRPGKHVGERVHLYLEAQALRGAAGWQPACGKLLVTLPAQELPPVGSALVVKGPLRAPRTPRNPGAFDRVLYLAADGIFREMPLRDRDGLVLLAYPRRAPLGEKLRGGVRRQLAVLDPVSRAVYQSMLLGDQGEITPEIRAVLARTGTSHLLVINGLHLSMVAAVVYFLAFWLLRRCAWLLLRLNALKTATLLAAAAVVAYAWVAGGSPSTQRAEVMVLAYLLLVFLGRPREYWSTLALAALGILCLAPLRLFSISFQLSFAAVAGLTLAGPWIFKGASAGPTLEGAPRGAVRVWFRVKEWLLVSLVVVLATAPLVAAHFQVVSLAGVAVNVVAIPLVLGLSLPLGEAAVLAQALGLPGLSQGLLFLGKWPLLLAFKAIRGAALLPGSALTIPIPTPPQLAAYYLFFGLLAAPWSGLVKRAAVPAAALLLAVTLTLPFLAAPRGLELTCLDTAGDLAAVAVAPGGQRLVVSAASPLWWGKQGGGPGALPAYLHWRQFRRLDQVVALSLSQGNAPELLALARQFSLRECWCGRRGPEGPAYWEFWNLMGDRGRAPRSLERQPPSVLGAVGLAFPRLGERTPPALELSFQGRRALVLPPLRRGEAENLALPAPGSVDLLVLPAALAQDAGLAPLWTRLRPGCLVVYGPPRPSLPPGGPLAGVPCHFTREGAVTARLSAAGLDVKPSRR